MQNKEIKSNLKHIYNAVQCWCHARMCHAARAQYLPRSGKEQGDNDAGDASEDLGRTKCQTNAALTLRWHSARTTDRYHFRAEKQPQRAHSNQETGSLRLQSERAWRVLDIYIYIAQKDTQAFWLDLEPYFDRRSEKGKLIVWPNKSKQHKLSGEVLLVLSSHSTFFFDKHDAYTACTRVLDAEAEKAKCGWEHHSNILKKAQKFKNKGATCCDQDSF